MKNNFRREIPWLRILAEGTAIVVSILLAFAIDAWWDERQEAAAQRAQMRALLEEFREARSQLEVQVRHLQISLQGTLGFLSLMSPNASNKSLEEVRLALRESLDVGVFSPHQGTLQDFLAARGNTAFGSAELWAWLQDWPRMMLNLDVDAQHLENNREERFVDALIRLRIPMSEIIAPPAGQPEESPVLGLPESKLGADVSALLSDPGINTVFTMRAVRSRILIQNHNDAIQVADKIIKRLEETP